MAEGEFHIVVGDRYTPIGRTLMNGATPLNLTGLTVEFKMVDKDGVTKVDWTAAAVVTAASGTVQYNWAANDVNTAGKYYGWFRAYDGTRYSHYPADNLGIPIFIHTIAVDENF